LEALRDGLEDYEYLWTLNELVQRAAQLKIAGIAVDNARDLLSIDELVKATGSYSPHVQDYLAHRRKIAEAIVDLNTQVSKTLGR
jgi:hypothetical protein